MSARKLPVLYTEPAQADLRDILNYTEQEWGKAQRTVYRQLIRTTVSTLAQAPLLGRSRNELSEGLRSYPINSHLLYYWEIHGVLVIARVLHNRREPSREEWPKPPQPE